jgi:hypothetical protein
MSPAALVALLSGLGKSVLAGVGISPPFSSFHFEKCSSFRFPPEYFFLHSAIKILNGTMEVCLIRVIRG